MGADIHMVLERKWRSTTGNSEAIEKWVGVNAFPWVKASMYAGDTAVSGHVSWPVTDRNYDLFGDIAGVRRQGPAPRGIPEDVSDLAMMEIEAWDSDGHSHTWLLLREALPLFIEHGQLGKPDKAVLTAFKHGTEAALEEYVSYFHASHDEGTLDDYRLVIWFDN